MNRTLLRYIVIGAWLIGPMALSVFILSEYLTNYASYSAVSGSVLATTIISAPLVLALWYIRIKHKEDDIRLVAERTNAERFSRAIDHLGSTNGGNETILGAIYELEHISRDSVKEHVATIEAIAAYVRLNHPVHAIDCDQDIEDLKKDMKRHILRSAIIVIGRRAHTETEQKAKNGQKQIDLTSTDLRKLRFVDGNYEGVLFWKSDFTGAYLRYGRFKEANFKQAIFDGAKMNSKTDLTKARLVGAKLRNAEGLHEANLKGATYNVVTNEKLPEVTEFPDDFNPEDYDMVCVEG